jgi:hypothetical protein
LKVIYSGFVKVLAGIGDRKSGVCIRLYFSESLMIKTTGRLDCFPVIRAGVHERELKFTSSPFLYGSRLHYA